MHADFPVRLMNHAMVSPAQHHQVFDIRFAAIDPFADVMHLAPGGFTVTPGMRAASVAGGDGFALGEADAAAFPTEVEWLARAVEDHRGNSAVTQQGT